MILQLPDVESFIAEAREAGVERVWTAFETETRSTSGLRTHRTWFFATAVGMRRVHVGGPEKVLLRFERDFGSVLEDIVTRQLPEDYAHRTEEEGARLRQRLSEAGFEMRAGVVVSV
ncbi:MAG: hypothetical protein QHH75_04875 [Bacillota bacterium]|nr:hypothetical protein [Bacillota bacterium]